MAVLTPPEIAVAAVDAGAAKAETSRGRLLVGGGLAGAFIAFGGLMAVAVTSGLDPKTWGTAPQFLTGAAFSVGLMLVVIAGAELVTGGIALVALAALKGRASWPSVGKYLLWTTLGALGGSLLVAYFFGVKSGVLTGPLQAERLDQIATLKAIKETDWQIFLRGVGCNWLVCLAVWMAMGAKDVGGKILAIFFPIAAFVAMGFDHVVANMFFLPAAHFAGSAVGWDDILRNLALAGLGNLVGALVFVTGAYWFLYARFQPSATPSVAVPEADGVPEANGVPTASPDPDLVPAGARS